MVFLQFEKSKLEIETRNRNRNSKSKLELEIETRNHNFHNFAVDYGKVAPKIRSFIPISIFI